MRALSVSLLAALSIFGAGWSAAQQAAPEAPPPLPRHSAAECAVWERELGFARAIDARDAQAFARHIHPGAVFNSSEAAAAVRGRAAIVESWAELIEGKVIRIRWRPAIVLIGGDPNVAISRGPYLLEDKQPGTQAPYSVGLFTTVWVKSGGEWLALFDGGDSIPQAVKTLKEAEDFVNGAPKTCPR